LKEKVNGSGSLMVTENPGNSTAERIGCCSSAVLGNGVDLRSVYALPSKSRRRGGQQRSNGSNHGGTGSSGSATFKSDVVNAHRWIDSALIPIWIHFLVKFHEADVLEENDGVTHNDNDNDYMVIMRIAFRRFKR
jgi:hypothetical protein